MVFHLKETLFRLLKQLYTSCLPHWDTQLLAFQVVCDNVIAFVKFVIARNDYHLFIII